jgi:hypothetical protein
VSFGTARKGFTCGPGGLKDGERLGAHFVRELAEFLTPFPREEAFQVEVATLTK